MKETVFFKYVEETNYTILHLLLNTYSTDINKNVIKDWNCQINADVMSAVMSAVMWLAAWREKWQMESDCDTAVARQPVSDDSFYLSRTRGRSTETAEGQKGQNTRTEKQTKNQMKSTWVQTSVMNKSVVLSNQEQSICKREVTVAWWAMTSLPRSKWFITVYCQSILLSVQVHKYTFYLDACRNLKEAIWQS